MRLRWRDSATQVYTYDSLNRLIQASENNSTCTAPGSAWCQHFAYDTAGNRRMDQSSGYGISPWEVAQISGANNRITDANWRYDDTGNITKPPIGGQTIGYDAENRQVSFCVASEQPCPSTWATGRTVYIYDGLGRRVAKKDGYGTQTVFVFDAFGNLAAEYNPTGAPVDRTQYVTADNLGSTRLVTTASGTERHDYHPFGFEAIGGWRTTALGYGASSPVRQQFTGAEYDSESSLNFLQARYLSTPQGRFTSVDPRNAGAALGDPQSWNGYAYVSNNPLNYTDPNGEGIFSWLGSLVGGYFLGPVGAMIGWAAGSAGEAALWGPSSNIGGLPGIGGFFNCGGPLGNCGGTLGAGPWSERSPVGETVEDPGRFILSAQGGAQIRPSWSFRQAFCSVFQPLLTLSRASKTTIGAGFGGNVGVGFGIGGALAIGFQAVADPTGNVGLAINLNTAPGIGVFGASAMGGAQASASTSKTISGLSGWSLSTDVSAGAGPAVDVAVSRSFSSWRGRFDGPVTLTTTVGKGVGTKAAVASTGYTAVPLTIGCGR